MHRAIPISFQKDSPPGSGGGDGGRIGGGAAGCFFLNMPNIFLCGLRRLTTQAQRPGARDATIATATLPPGSLQRMVRPLCWDDQKLEHTRETTARNGYWQTSLHNLRLCWNPDASGECGRSDD